MCFLTTQDGFHVWLVLRDNKSDPMSKDCIAKDPLYAEIKTSWQLIVACAKLNSENSPRFTYKSSLITNLAFQQEHKSLWALVFVCKIRKVWTPNLSIPLPPTCSTSLCYNLCMLKRSNGYRYIFFY